MIPAGLKDRLRNYRGARAELVNMTGQPKPEVAIADFALAALEYLETDPTFVPDSLACVWCRDPGEPRTCLDVIAEGELEADAEPCAVGRLARELGVAK